MVCDTHLPAVVVYSGRQDLPENARAFSLTSFETQSSSCNYLSFRLFSLFSKVSPGSESLKAIFLCQGMPCFVMLGPAH